ncbi:prolactin-7A2-like isoform X2 [Mesocricetus auratus]|uniref:Prolactin-7A2-like isoform X2 n=1 Tax=Mesocricetus auratus TaxID=10036 RepID=A0ABM2YAH6_MESAU|nr:prolactin-7A2-like isoform X2 [Mesocricetus auratus]
MMWTINWRWDCSEEAKLWQDCTEMPLTYSQPCSWALQLLLVSNLLLWENVASVPLSSNETDDQLYLKTLFDHAIMLSQNISKLNIEMRRMYADSEFSEKFHHKFLASSSESYNQFMLEFFEDQEFMIKHLTCCHNYSMKTPESMDEAQMISLQDFPKLILSRVRAWNDTLKNFLTILGNRPGTHNDVVSLAKDIERKNAELSEDIKKILSSVSITRENVDYTVLTGLEDLQSSDEEFRLFTLCKLSYCLRVDMNMLDLCLKLLRCVLLVKSDICLSQRIRNDS